MVIKEASLRGTIRSELKKLVLEARKNRLLEQEGTEEKDVKVKSVSDFKKDMLATLDSVDIPAARLEGVSELMKALMEKISEGDTSTLGKLANLLNVNWKTGEEKK
tara:strand:+ start:87 stop:404 length:318 start_codon:yes stop_codon:yes gene_type:complete